MLYLDYAAGAPIDPQVVETVTRAMIEYDGNPNSTHKVGTHAAHLLTLAKRQTAQFFGVHEDELIFTSGGSESNNLAIKGVARAYRHRGNHLITTAVEHASVYECMRQLEKHEQYELTVLPVNRYGMIDPQQLMDAVTERTILVSVTHIAGEIGTVQPIYEIAEKLRNDNKILFHVDAAQSISTYPIRPHESGIDLLSGSAQKWCGPKGAGFLFCRRGVQIHPQIVGGQQHGGVRAGTENVAMFAGLAKALRLHGAQANQPETLERLKRLRTLRAYWVDKFALLPGVEITGSPHAEEMARHIVHLCIAGCRAETVVRALSDEGFYVSSQSACSARSGAASRVLLALGKSDEQARSGIRISYGDRLTFTEIDTFIEVLQRILQKTTT